MDDYASFANDNSKWEQVSMATWVSLNICPFLTQFQVMEISWLGLSAISHADAWGAPRSLSQTWYTLLLAPDQSVEEERKFGLVAVWTHPCQAHLPSLDEVARKLALLINTGEGWAYVFMQLNKGSQHIPLATIRHISAMIDSTPSRST